MTRKEIEELVKKLNAAIEAKAIIIDGSALQLTAQAKALERKLSRKFTELAAGFETVDGKIVLSTANVVVLNGAITQLTNQYLTGQALIGIEIVKSIDKIVNASNSYFGIMVDKVPNYSVRAKNKLAKRLGIDGGQLLKNGYLANKLGALDPIDRIKAKALQGIAKNASRKEFMSQVLLTIQGNIDPVDPKPGIIAQHNTGTEMDLFYSQYERMYANEVAKDVGMDKARYSGPIMSTTRAWCLQHVGKVLTRKEIMSWIKKTWKGKNSPYDPLTDAGGYNCNHTWDWITDIIADFLLTEYPPEAV